MKYRLMWLFIFGSIALVPVLLLGSGFTLENVVLSSVLLVTVAVFIIAFLRAPRRNLAQDCRDDDSDDAPAKN